MKQGCYSLLSIALCLAATLFLRAATPQRDKAPADVNPTHRSATADDFSPPETPDDPGEQKAFAALINETNQLQRNRMAAKFLADFPQSNRLAPVYEIASKANLALGNIPAALEFGAKSIRILPENPFLLLAMADAQTRAGLYADSRRSAQDALWYLDRFDRPTSIEAADWPRRKSRLQAEGWFDIGRAAAAQGLAATGDTRNRLLADAEAALLKAVSFDTGGAGAALLLGMVYLGDGRPNDAAAAFALAARAEGPARAQAMDRLRAIYADNSLSGGRPFEEWVGSLTLSLPDPPRQARKNPPKKVAYAGSEVCRECHTPEYAAWHSTGMGRMLRPYEASEVFGEFSGKVLPDDKGRPAARPVLQDGRHFMEIREADNWTRYPVEFVIGSKWQQGYATRLPGGEIQVFPLQYNRLEKRWLNYWKMVDPAESPRTDITRFREGNPGGTYQLNCAACHTSQERFEGGVMKASAASFREGGINCEMCHGPSSRHVEEKHAGVPYDKTRDPAEAPVDFKRISPAEYVAICSQCHMQSADHDPEPAGAMNYSETGDKFYRILSSRPFVDYSRKAFYRDGRFRETVFIAESFVRSACFRKGGATCGNCHNPHPADAPTNPVSLKFANEPDRMCVACHEQFRANPQAHTHHAAASEASRCVSCHMPRIMNALLFEARSHQIDDVPDAEMAARFGPSESPNACLMCHKDRNAAWLTASLSAWKEKNRRASK